VVRLGFFVGEKSLTAKEFNHLLRMTWQNAVRQAQYERFESANLSCTFLTFDAMPFWSNAQ